MRIVLAILATALLSTASFAQEEIDSLTTSSTSRADESCSADIKLDLQRFKDFAEKLSPAKSADPAPIRPSIP